MEIDRKTQVDDGGHSAPDRASAEQPQKRHNVVSDTGGREADMLRQMGIRVPRDR